MRFVPTDFNVGGLGPSPIVPTLFLWEGVTNYLTDEAVDATLRWCADAAPGSQLVMTYIDRRFLTHPDEYHGARRLRSTLRRAGEPMTFGISPADLPGYLAERGFELVSDIGAAEFRERYVGAVRGHEFYRVAHARVTGSGG